MQLLQGLRYNLRGFAMGFRSGKLLFWGLLRFLFVLAVTILVAGIILAHHQDIMAALWVRPESVWVLWLWHLLAWLVTLVLVGVSVLFSYLLAQILFNVFVMDLMSRITERMVTGGVVEGGRMSFFALFAFLVKQEIPRAVAPVGFSLAILFLGWFTPLGPVLIPLSSAAAIVFLAWDNTDLTPARRARPFPAACSFTSGSGSPFSFPA
jgi:CysZ protein